MFDTAKVFGRKLPEANREEPSFNEEAKEKKGKIYSTGSQYLFREISLFIPETIGLAVGVLGAMMLGFIGMVLNNSLLMMGAIAIPVVVMVVFYMVRMMLFMPNKNRHLTQRILPSGAIRYSVDDATKGEIPFDRSPMSPKIRITNPRRNINFATGQPVITLKCGHGENVDLSKSENTSQQAQDFDNLVITAIGVQKAWDEYNIAAPKKNMEMIIFIMCAITIIAGFAAAYMAYQNTDLLNQLVALAKHSATVAATAVAPAVA